MALTRREKDKIRDSACVGCGRMPPFEDGGRCQVHRIVPGRDGGKYTHGNVEPRCWECHCEVHPDSPIMNGGSHVEVSRLGGRTVHERHPDLARVNGIKAYESMGFEERREWHRKGGRKTTAKRLSKGLNPWGQDLVEGPRQAGRSTHKKHPNLASQRLRETHRKYPNLAADNGRKVMGALAPEERRQRGLDTLAAMTPEQRAAFHRKGGKAGGPKGGRSVVAMRAAAGLDAYGRTKEEQRRTNSERGAKGCHVRWHVGQGVKKPGCPFCEEA